MTTDHRNQKRISLLSHIKPEHLAAGVAGGVVSSLALHPLDLIKVRFQVDEGTAKSKVLPLKGPLIHRPEYKGIYDAFRSIVHQEGWKGLYRGVTPNVTGAGLSWGLYFFFYNTTKTWWQQGDSSVNLGPGKHMFIASLAGLATLSLTNPIWVSKTRMCLNYSLPGQTTGKIRFLGMWEVLSDVFRTEGVRGLYRGFLPGIFGISHGAIQFMCYEEMKTCYNNYRQQPVDTRLGSVEYLTFAALSKMVAAFTTYPYQVVRSRLQDQHRSYNGAMDVIKQIIKHQQFWGLYKGLNAYMLHIMPNIMIVFGMYEAILTLYENPSSQRLVYEKSSLSSAADKSCASKWISDDER